MYNTLLHSYNYISNYKSSAGCQYVICWGLHGTQTGTKTKTVKIKKERSFTIVVISVHTPVLFSDTNLSDNNNMSDSATEGRDEVSYSNSDGWRCAPACWWYTVPGTRTVYCSVHCLRDFDLPSPPCTLRLPDWGQGMAQWSNTSYQYWWVRWTRVVANIPVVLVVGNVDKGDWYW